MARIFIDSFETQKFDLWDSATGTPLIESTVGYDMKGNYYTFLGSNDYLYKSVPAASEYYFAFQYRPYDLSNHFFRVLNGSTELNKLRLDAGKLHAYAGTTLIASGTKSFSTSTTYFLQIYIKVDNINGRIQVKYDGVTDIDYTGDTLRAGFSTINMVKIGEQIRFDNFIIDDSVMPEETEICLLKPNGIGNASNWAPTSGNNYACVDEVPHNDADYVSENVADAIDTYITENSPGDVVSVKCIQLQARARKDSDSLLDNMNLVVRSDADYHGNDESLTTSFVEKVKIWETNPADSLVWEKADIDAMEIGVRARA